MSKKMLVDTSHPEETRVVVVSGNRVEEFDYENAERRQLKGNIYLAKVTRVEPSLQACFVEYGGNRHGFLPFSEIHPDYYQIPVADRQALLAQQKIEERSAADDESDADDAAAAATNGSDDPSGEQPQAAYPDHLQTRTTEYRPGDIAGEVSSSGSVDVEPEPSAGDDAGRVEDIWIDPDAPGPNENAQTDYAPGDPVAVSDASDSGTGETDEPDDEPGVESEVETVDTSMRSEDIETIGAEDAMEEVPSRHPRNMRRYKIQEVIKRRQILLVQVVKEERGSKGAALTTFLSLAGRYCVLMPNTDRGGGISRKIANPADRRKLKELASELDVPDSMGVIIRTAGANRTKQEIRRDFEYLLREWEAVREFTLRSTAPTLVYEEGSLIKRTIRDLFSKDIDGILVQGVAGFEEARDFMRLIMPSHVNIIELYQEPLPLFQAHGVETQLDAMFSPTVRLRSGGYVVINQTEALVSIDVNSGKATREHNIEDTALKTNLEASDEIARQLRLRDLAGLVVIDFIDMEESRNNRHVEKRLKDALKHDRARIQVGRISPFGLLEMSRQRLRSGMVEGSTVPCPHCEGRGIIRSVGSMALRVLRAVEEHCQRQRDPAITLRLPPEIAIYILNHKRAQLGEIEERHTVYIYIEAKPSLTASSYEIELGAPVAPEPRRERKPAGAVSLERVFEEFTIDEEEGEAAATGEADADQPDESVSVSEIREVPEASTGQDRSGGRKRRRRGRGRDEPGATGGEPRSDRGPRHERARRPDRAPHAAQDNSSPRAQFSERPFGMPSPAEFNFLHHDLPDTSPEAFEKSVQRNVEPGADDLDERTQPDDQGRNGDIAASNSQANGPREERDPDRRGRRRGRRGRRGRDGERSGDDHRQGRQGNKPSTIAPSQELHSPAAPHPSLKRSDPVFEIAPQAPRKEFAGAEPRRQPAPKISDAIAMDTESTRKSEPVAPNSDWNLASFFGLRSKEPQREPQKEPVHAAPQPAAIEPKAPETMRPAGPKKPGWWQKDAAGE
jgi:ribonuclease E